VNEFTAPGHDDLYFLKGKNKGCPNAELLNKKTSQINVYGKEAGIRFSVVGFVIVKQGFFQVGSTDHIGYCVT
jgi:hypothetical protein